MSKKKKSQKPNNNQTEVKEALDASLVQNDEMVQDDGMETETAEVETPVKEQNVPEQKDKNKNDNKKAKNKKPKERGKVKRMVKESLSEIKNVVWPSFSDVVKRTGVVLAVVFVFAVIIFGIDFGLGKLVNLLRK